METQIKTHHVDAMNGYYEENVHEISGMETKRSFNHKEPLQRGAADMQTHSLCVQKKGPNFSHSLHHLAQGEVDGPHHTVQTQERIPMQAQSHVENQVLQPN